MNVMRHHKGLIARLAGLAMLAHVLAAAFCPNMASHTSSRGYFDSVLGWVTLCVTNTASSGLQDNTSGGNQNHSGHSNTCAAVCAAVVITLAAFAAIVATAIVTPISKPAFFYGRTFSVSRRFSLGGIGSRAPPALV